MNHIHRVRHVKLQCKNAIYRSAAAGFRKEWTSSSSKSWLFFSKIGFGVVYVVVYDFLMMIAVPMVKTELAAQ